MPPATKGDQVQIGISQRRQPLKNAVSGYDGHHQKVDGATTGLESYIRTDGRIFRRPHT